MKVLVTGARGLLGGAVAWALARRGDDVTVFQRHPSGLPFREVLGDVADAERVAGAVTGHEAVVHLAARVAVTGPWHEYERTNVTGTRRLLRACRDAGVARVVHVSSPSVAYAGAALVGAGADPADPAAAHGCYARSKALAEQVALGADGPDLAVLAVRPHLVWGPGDTQLVHRIAVRARRGHLPLLGGGTALVDTTYLPNAVDALLAALDRCHLVHGRALVVSNGEPRPVGEVLAAVCRAAGVPWRQRRVPRGAAWLAAAGIEGVWTALDRLRPDGAGEPPFTRVLVEQVTTAHWFDQRRTRQLLAWEPRVPLDEGFAELGRWYSTMGGESG